MNLWTVDLTVSVFDRPALWRKARDYMLGMGSDMESVKVIIGTEAEPDVGGCLAMLLDRSELLDGAEVEQHEVSEIGGDDDD